MGLEDRIKDLFAEPNAERTPATLRLLAEFRSALNGGSIRVASCENGQWAVHLWVKQGLTLLAKLGRIQPRAPDGGRSFELDTFPLREFLAEEGIRIPNGASWVRDGVYIGPGVCCWPPLVVNIGAYIGRDSVIDSHAMVGVCAQIGERVRISSGSQIGGVISPPERLPNIIEDDVIIGGNCGVYDGVLVGKGAMLAAGTILTAQSLVYDLVRQERYAWSPEKPLSIPAGAIVFPGARPLNRGLASGSGLLLQVPVIVGYQSEDGMPANLLNALVG